MFAVTGALASYAPAIAQVSGPVEITQRLGPEELQLTVDPATAGPNVMHLYLLDAKTGAQFDGAKELTVQATQTAKGIGPRTGRHRDRARPLHDPRRRAQRARHLAARRDDARVRVRRVHDDSKVDIR